MNHYAKSRPPETIIEHTIELLKRLEQLQATYAAKFSNMTEVDWRLLRYAILYHDVGKYNPVFQNKIRKVLRELEFLLSIDYDLQHNLLSVLAVPSDLEVDEEDYGLLYQAVAYHHEREGLNSEDNLEKVYNAYFPALKKIIEEGLSIRIADRGDAYPISMIKSRYTEIENGSDFYRYVLIKGLLHRLDHAASAHVPIAAAVDANPGLCTEHFIQRSFPRTGLSPLQQFSRANRDNHIVALAQTGMGKTEAGLLWIGDDKAFFTLPLRVSLNSMYKRLVDRQGLNLDNPNSAVIALNESLNEKEMTEDFTGEQVVGLLHSTSLDYLEQMLGEEDGLKKPERSTKNSQKDEERLTVVHSATKEYANPLTVCTVDQILKFRFIILVSRKSTQRWLIPKS